jgi:hypothetical protein
MPARRGTMRGMSRRTATATALAAACVVAVSACTSTVAGTPLAARGGATVTAAPTTTVAPTPVAAPPPVWVPLPARPPTRPDNTDNHAQFGAVAGTGVKVVHWTSGDRKMCTLGPTVMSDDGRLGYLTAGHCGIGPGAQAQFLQTDADGAVSPFGTVTDPVDDGFAVDSTVIWTRDQGGSAPSSVAGLPVVRVMPEAEVHHLPTDTPICVYGAKSGTRCTPLTSTLSTILFGDPLSDVPAAQSGDSGGAVFVTDGRTAVLIGLVMDVDDRGFGKATYLEPALTRLGARVAGVS